jgi:hypothetical protein
MSGPYADYSVALLNTILSTTSNQIYKFDAPNVVKNRPGLLQLEIQTEGTNGLKAVLKLNDKEVFSYGPSSTNLTRVLQAVIPGDTFKVRNNLLSGEVVAGSGNFRVRNIAFWWQGE